MWFDVLLHFELGAVDAVDCASFLRRSINLKLLQHYSPL